MQLTYNNQSLLATGVMKRMIVVLLILEEKQLKK